MGTSYIRNSECGVRRAKGVECGGDVGGVVGLVMRMTAPVGVQGTAIIPPSWSPMPRMPGRFVSLAAAPIIFCLVAAAGPPAQQSYFPPPGSWASKPPRDLGMDPAQLADAVAFAQSHETERAMDFSDQTAYLVPLRFCSHAARAY